MSNYKGVKRGSKDYQDIANLFETKVYRKGSYKPEVTRNSNQAWRERYDPQSFALSVRNIVAELCLRVPQVPAGQVETETMDTDTGMVPPNAPNISASGDHLLTPLMVWKIPRHDVPWVDSSTNQNNRLTVYTQLLPGKTEKHYTARVEGQGSELLLQCKWPEEFLSADLLLKSHRASDGSDFYPEGHNKIIAFKDHVRGLRGGKSDASVTSENRSLLLHPVEEQLPRSEVPNGTHTGNLKVQNGVIKVLGVELMGIRTNYETRKVDNEFEWAQGGGATATESPTAAAAADRQRQTAETLARQRSEQVRIQRNLEAERQRLAQEAEEERRNLEEGRQRLAQQAEEQRRHQEWLAGEQERMAESEHESQHHASKEKRRIEAALKAQCDQQLLEERQRMQSQFFNQNRTGTALGAAARATAPETTALLAGGGKKLPLIPGTNEPRPMPKVVDQNEKKVHRQQSMKDRQQHARELVWQQGRSQSADSIQPQAASDGGFFPPPPPVLHGLPHLPLQIPAPTYPIQQRNLGTAGPKTTGEDTNEIEMTGQVSDEEEC